MLYSTFAFALMNVFVKQLSHLPVFADPSHGVGVRHGIAAVARAAVAAGADGLLIEVHPDPPHARSDGDQSLSFPEFGALMDELRRLGIGQLFGPGTPTSELADYIKKWFAERQQQEA